MRQAALSAGLRSAAPGAACGQNRALLQVARVQSMLRNLTSKVNFSTRHIQPPGDAVDRLSLTRAHRKDFLAAFHNHKPIIDGLAQAIRVNGLARAIVVCLVASALVRVRYGHAVEHDVRFPAQRKFASVIELVLDNAD